MVPHFSLAKNNQDAIFTSAQNFHHLRVCGSGVSGIFMVCCDPGVMRVRLTSMISHSRWVHRSSRLGSHRKDGKHEEFLAAFNLRRILQ